jgi:serine/threonine-protein kinase
MTTFQQRLKETLARTYVIERELGGGGMSRVFVAIDRSSRRKVVMKLLTPEVVANLDPSRFRREIQVAAHLQHPNIVPLLSAGEHEDLLWYTMPFIAGQSLKSALWKKGPMSVPDVVRILFQVSEALEYAHGEGVVHRDIRPANVLRSGDFALVTDFGVAKALDASMPAPGIPRIEMAIGTRAHMAPEQLSGDPLADHRIDIYATGLLAYELLKGRSPFAAAPFVKGLVDPSQEPPPLIEVRPDVPRSLSELVMRCLAKDPDDRPATARAMLNALDEFSTASGEIRTTAHMIESVEPPVPPAASGATEPVAVSGTTEPIAVPVTPAQEQTVPVNEPTEADKVEVEVEAAGYGRPKKDRTKLVAGVAILVPVAAGAFLLGQRTGNQPSNVVAPPSNAAGLVAESAVSMEPAPAAVPKRRARAAKRAKTTIDSQAIRDSLARAAAKLAAARIDSLRKADSVRVETRKANARRAAGALLSNASARKAFLDGATHKGGILGTKRMGDLQTQIDALMPFLSQSGLTYEQFKDIVADSGVWLFDEFGRMVPAALRQFAGSGG